MSYAVFRRNEPAEAYWQGIAGGGEGDESPIEAARREALEEAGIPVGSEYVMLDSRTTIPVVHVCGFKWGENVLVIPEYSFGVAAEREAIRLSHEHTEFAWLDYQSALNRLRWDSNRSALWELDIRLRRSL